MERVRGRAEAKGLWALKMTLDPGDNVRYASLELGGSGKW